MGEGEEDGQEEGEGERSLKKFSWIKVTTARIKSLL